MLEALQARKEALQKQGAKGFTLMEMLIVIAIIAVLIAIAIPIMSAQLENSREATDKANLRSAYAEVVTAYLNDGAEHTATVTATQKETGWQSGDAMIGSSIAVTNASGAGATGINAPASTGNWTVKITTAGVVTIEAGSASGSGD